MALQAFERHFASTLVALVFVMFFFLALQAFESAGIHKDQQRLYMLIFF